MRLWTYFAMPSLSSRRVSGAQKAKVNLERLQFLLGSDYERKDAEKTDRKLAHLLRKRRRRSTYIPQFIRDNALIWTIDMCSRAEEEAWENRRDGVDYKEGLSLVIQRFGLPAGLLVKLWKRIGQDFMAQLDSVRKVKKLTAESVFLMTLQDLRLGQTFARLGEDWAMSASEAHTLMQDSIPILRSLITSTNVWPPPNIEAAYSEALDRLVLGAVDCRFERRYRIHPGQREYYRGDKSGHGVTVQCVCSVSGACSYWLAFFLA